MIIDKAYKVFPQMFYSRTIVNVQNVADYIYMSADKETFEDDFFPSCIPPWSHCCLYYKMPPYTWSKEKGKEIVADRLYMLAFIDYNPSTNKTITCQYVLHSESSGIFILPGLSLWGLDENYDFKTNLTTHKVSQEQDCRILNNAELLIIGQPTATILLNQILVVFLFAFTLANCKNVSVIKNNLDQKVIKKRRQEGKFPHDSFYTIEINKGMGNRNSSISSDEANNRYHLCRGHFKDFRHEKKLFGKYDGIWWWHQHLRGQKELGEINKNYSI